MIDRGNGLFYDTVLNITWLQDANYAFTSGQDADGVFNWDDAKTWAADLDYQGFSDWRLPNMDVNGDNALLNECSPSGTEADCRDNEYAYMFYYNLNGVWTEDKTGNQVGDTAFR